MTTAINPQRDAASTFTPGTGRVVRVRVAADDERAMAMARRWIDESLPGEGFRYEFGDLGCAVDDDAELTIVSGAPSEASSQLAERASGTFVFVPAEWSPQPGPIIAATGHDLESDAAIGPALALAHQAHRPMILAHVWGMPGLGIVDLPPDPFGVGSIPDGQSGALDALVRHILDSPSDVSITARVRQGHQVATELLQLAAAEQASGIVVGRPARGHRHSALGKVARELLRVSPRPLVIVPARVGP